jgi:hypothetical protein
MKIRIKLIIGALVLPFVSHPTSAAPSMATESYTLEEATELATHPINGPICGTSKLFAIQPIEGYHEIVPYLYRSVYSGGPEILINLLSPDINAVCESAKEDCDTDALAAHLVAAQIADKWIAQCVLEGCLPEHHVDDNVDCNKGRVETIGAYTAFQCNGDVAFAYPKIDPYSAVFSRQNSSKVEWTPESDYEYLQAYIHYDDGDLERGRGFTFASCTVPYNSPQESHVSTYLTCLAVPPPTQQPPPVTPPEGPVTPPGGTVTPPDGTVTPSGGVVTPTDGPVTPSDTPVTP